MNEKLLLESLDKDEALGFFGGSGIPTGDNTITQSEEDTDKSDEDKKDSEKDPRKNGNFNKSFDEPDFGIDDLVKEVLGTEEDNTRTDLISKNEEPVEEVEDNTNTTDTDFDYNSLISEGILSPFEDSDEIKDSNELKELLKANLETKYEDGKNEGIKELVDSLPEELRLAIKYSLDGGDNIKGFMSKLNNKTLVKELDVENEKDQEEIIRQVLKSQDLSDEEIAEEIESYKDLDSLKRMATKFKPRLDKIREKEVKDELAATEQLKEQAKEQAKIYTDSIKDALKGDDLFGYKIDSKLKGNLIEGMSNALYPSISGNKTNLLGKLLEKYQIEEPDMQRVMGATLFLLDPEEFMKQVNLKQKQVVEKETIRKIKNVNINPTVTNKTVNPTNTSKINKTKNFFSPF